MKSKLIDYLILLIWAYVIVIIPPFFIIYIFNIFTPDSDLFYNLVQKIPDFTTLIGLAIIFPGLGVYLSFKTNKIKPVYVWKYSLKDNLPIFTISFFISYVFWRFFSLLSFLNYWGLFILFSFFVIYFPQAFVFINSIDFSNFKVFFEPEKKTIESYKQSAKKILLAIAVLIFVNFVVMGIDQEIKAINHHLTYLSRHPKIKKIKPYIVYYGNKAVFLGKGFGWKGTINTKFYTRQGELQIDLWTDNKIIFTVPLHWKLGEIYVWVEKPLFWDGKNVSVRSNEVKLKLIDRTGAYNTDDEAYFEQLKHLDEETLRINGYAP